MTIRFSNIIQFCKDLEGILNAHSFKIEFPFSFSEGGVHKHDSRTPEKNDRDAIDLNMQIPGVRNETKVCPVEPKGNVVSSPETVCNDPFLFVLYGHI